MQSGKKRNQIVIAALLLQGPGGRNLPVDDIRGAFVAMRRIPALAAAVATAILSMGLFNWFGVCITISLSGVTRLTIDACRTLLVWAGSLALGWERFSSFQLLGFLVLVCGATLYNELMAGLLEQPLRCSPLCRSAPLPLSLHTNPTTVLICVVE